MGVKLDVLEKDTNPEAEWKARRSKVLGCSYCKPNQNENGHKGNKHFQKGWKVKTKRKKQFSL